MDVRVGNRYVAQVFLNELGWTGLTLMDNKQLDLFHVKSTEAVPAYVHERVALLRLCEIDEQQRGELNGRNLGPGSVLLYLTYDEFNELTSLGVQERP